MTTCRLVAVSLRLDLARAQSVTAFRGGLAELLDRRVVAHPDGETLVTFPEHTGLLAGFVGGPGEAARRRLAEGAPAVEALGELAGGHAAALDHAARRFPEVASLGALLQLALTDTLVRAVHETFSGLAAERGLWLSVGAAMADWEATDDAAARAAIDPGGTRTQVYVASRPQVRNRNLVYAPDGTLATVQDKAYLVPMERDHEAGLGLTACGLSEVGVADLPIGRLATVISKDAWMPDVNERLEQLGAEVLVQPEAFDRWARVDRDGDVADLWPPDKFQRGGWWMLQRHRGLRANVTPMLVGTLGDLGFDGQALIAVPTPGGVSGLGLLGQPPDGGWAAVGAYDHLDEPAAALADEGRRAEFDALGTRLAPGSGDRLEGAVAEDVVWADVDLPQRPAPRPLPTGVAAPASVEVAPGTDTQLVPDLATDGERAWLALVACGHDVSQGVMVTAGDGGDWGPPRALAPEPVHVHDQFDRQWRPRLTVVDGRPACAYLAFPQESWDVFAATWNGDGFGRPARVDDADDAAGVLRERGHDAPVLLADHRAPGRLVAVWSDLRWPWVLPQVRLASSHDGGGTWSPSVRVDGGSLAGEPDPLAPRSRHETAGQTAPSVTVTAAGLVIAWQERGGDGRSAVRVVRGEPDGLSAPEPLVDGAACYRPVLAAVGDRVWLVWEQDELRDPPRAARPGVPGGGGLVFRRSDDAGATWTPPRALDPDLPAGATQRACRLVAVAGDRVLAVWEDDRGGSPRVLGRLLDDAHPGPVRRLCDAPRDADARAPVACLRGREMVLAWQDTRGAAERVRTRVVPVEELWG